MIGVQRHAALRAHFTFLPCEAKTFHFCAVGLSYVFVYDDNYAEQASIRVRRRVMDLRADLDKGAAGNTCCIVKAHLCKGVRKDAPYCVPA